MPIVGPVQIRRLLPADAAAFQALRLLGLLESPTAFGSSHEEESDRPLDDIAASLDEASGRIVFGAFDTDGLVGIVGVGRETGVKEHHRGFVRSLYVAPPARRQGVAQALMARVLQQAQALPGLRQLTLSVTEGHVAAIALYQALGFRHCGRAPEALLVHGRFHDKLQMMCRLPVGPQPDLQAMPVLQAIESVVLFVPEIETAARWYADLFGAEVEHENAQFAYVRGPGVLVGFHPADGKCPGGVGGTTVYWEVPDLDRSLATLLSRGARLHRGPGITTLGAHVAMLVDPFGCTIGLNQSAAGA